MNDLFFSGWALRDRIDEAQQQARRAHMASVRARLQLQQRVERLEEELHWMSAVAQALAAHCIEKGLMTDADLRDRIAKIEAAGAEAEKAAAAAAPPALLARRHPLRRRPRE